MLFPVHTYEVELSPLKVKVTKDGRVFSLALLKQELNSLVRPNDESSEHARTSTSSEVDD